MGYEYARDKFSIAIHGMVIGTGGIRTRIFEAYISFHVLTENDFPTELKADWNLIYEKLRTEEPTINNMGEAIIGKIENTLNKTSDEDCIEIANLIYDLNWKLYEYNQK